MAFAHTTFGPSCDWEDLEAHLVAVAGFTSAFASVFGAGPLGSLAGLWHDLGKYAPQFQQYLEVSAAGRPRGATVDHSTAGALHARSTVPAGPAQFALAFAIAGHHAGLADLKSNEDSCLIRRLNSPRPESLAALEGAPGHILAQRPAAIPDWLPARLSRGDAPLALSVFIRFLFSCLIDADRLATAAFTSRGQERLPGIEHTSIPALRAALDNHLSLMSGPARSPSPVDVHRADLLAACRRAADRPPGLFSLTAPTGSGKTLSSMAFALRHAEIHGLDRVVYALPFTSVTEQNARVFRQALAACGGHAVLEHHSAYHPPADRENDPSEVWRRLAVENWDAPVIVTTNVQLLESLFASGASDCRKLHRLARSVIVLDEAQTLPPHLLRPTLAAFDELASAYSSSIVLCSATMPAVRHRPDFSIGLRGVHEIVPDPEGMSRAMRRADVVLAGNLDDEALAARLAEHASALAIVNTRKHAARLFELVRRQRPDALHLSALMCPAHRSAHVAHMKARLGAAEPCLVVSTQVVEAGVDIDFPVVFRAMAGLDSIVQAAGRCNREGRRARGTVHVFETDEKPPPGIRDSLNATRQVLAPGTDPLDLATIEAFFQLHYWGKKNEWDGGVGDGGHPVGITAMLGPKRLEFRAAAAAYRIIDDWSESVVVPYADEGRSLCAEMLKLPSDLSSDARRQLRPLLRRAQAYTVSVRPFVLNALLESGICRRTSAGPIVVADPNTYDDDLGLKADPILSPEQLIR